ncbi:MAG: hypothetical protein ACOC5T_07310 [Elusimicrobiota bacterium]
MPNIEKREVKIEDLQGERYNALIEDAQSIIAEYDAASKMILVIGRWHLGDRIVEHFSDRPYGSSVLSKLSRDINIDKNTIYKSIKFRKKYPNFIDDEGNACPEVIDFEGVNLTWTKIRDDVLPENDCEHEETKIITEVKKIEVCKSCGKHLKTNKTRK